MALFGNTQEKSLFESEKAVVTQGDRPAYLGDAGGNLAELPPSAKAICYLNVTAELSQSVKDGLVKPGEFFNSGTQKAYGTSVDVICVGVKAIWDEREDAGNGKLGLSVNKYEPKSIPVKMRNVPGFSRPQMYNPETGNPIVDAYLFALVILNDPDSGIALYTSGVGSMGAIRQWVSGMTTSGLYAKKWRLTIGQKVSKRNQGKMYAAITRAQDLGWLTEEEAKAAKEAHSITHNGGMLNVSNASVDDDSGEED